MESLGEKLRTARNEKSLTFDQISRDTNISIRYLEALETENFSIFPGEPYLIGFLKNYSKYLELDVQKIIGLYRALRIQEQPIPVEQLLKPPLRISKVLVPVAISLAALCIVGLIVYYFVFIREKKPVENVTVRRVPTEYRLEGTYMNRRFYINDSVLIPVNNESYKLEIANLGEAVTIRTPGGSVILDLSQEANVDLNNDGIPELRITVVDFAKNNADMGAELYFSLMDTAALQDAENTEEDFSETANSSTIVNAVILPPPNTGQLNNAFPFTLQVTFQGYCMFRWEILNEPARRGRNEQYFQRSEEINVQAQNGIRIWTSNAQAARFQVIGGGRSVPVEIGATGEVVVADIRWLRDENNQYRLVLIRLEPGN